MDYGYSLFLRCGIALLLVVGCLQPLGYLFNMPVLKQVGIATRPMHPPLVFSHYKGVETFATRFLTISYEFVDLYPQFVSYFVNLIRSLVSYR